MNLFRQRASCWQKTTSNISQSSKVCLSAESCFHISWIRIFLLCILVVELRNRHYIRNKAFNTICIYSCLSINLIFSTQTKPLFSFQLILVQVHVPVVSWHDRFKVDKRMGERLAFVARLIKWVNISTWTEVCAITYTYTRIVRVHVRNVH